MNVSDRPTLRVLVVDDSAVARQAITSILSRQPEMEVAAAHDAYIARDKIRHRRPDVILLDLEMPGMHGLTFLRQLMSNDPIPVVICSAFAGRGTEAAVRALRYGAVGIVAKPTLETPERLEDSAVLLVDAVRAGARARVRRLPRLPSPVGDEDAGDGVRRKGGEPGGGGWAAPPSHEPAEVVVAIGASTGGTEAVREILAGLGPDSPGIVVVQHMPEGFTAAFAERLDATCAVAVKEAVDGDRIDRGRVLVAPGNRHTVVVPNGKGFAVRVTDGPLVSRHRPSVDVLFRSVSKAAGSAAVGILLTGMGADGAAGLLEMKEAGARTIAQDEGTCIVFGMPKEAIDLGAADRVLPLERIGRALVEEAGRDAGRIGRTT